MELREFTEYLVKSIVSHPDKVRVSEFKLDTGLILFLVFKPSLMPSRYVLPNPFLTKNKYLIKNPKNRNMKFKIF